MAPEIAIDVAVLPSLIELPVSGNQQTKRGAVVIDALRFTTTAVQALQVGASSIRVVQDIEMARRHSNPSDRSVLLCGERNCKPIQGFDLGNSPLEYDSERVHSRDLIFSTTNGTLAVQATADFADCLLGSLVNRSAVASYIAQSTIGQWTLICAGTDGQIAGEDLLAAGAIIGALAGAANLVLLNDAARLAQQLWQQIEYFGVANLFELLQSYSGGDNLLKAGYGKDIQFAAAVDSLSVVPQRQADGCFRTVGN